MYSYNPYTTQKEEFGSYYHHIHISMNTDIQLFGIKSN